MKNRGYYRDLALLDCYGSVAYAFQLRAERILDDNDVSLLQEGFKEFYLLALDGDIFVDAEENTSFKICDHYLKQKFEDLEEKFHHQRLSRERFLITRRLLLREGIFGILLEILPIAQAADSIHAKTLLACMQTLKKIYLDVEQIPIEEPVLCKFLRLNVGSQEKLPREALLDKAFLESLLVLLDFLKKQGKDFHPEWLSEVKKNLAKVSKIAAKKTKSTLKDDNDLTLASYNSIETLHEALLATEGQLPQAQKKRKTSTLEDFRLWLEREGHLWEKCKANILVQV